MRDIKFRAKALDNEWMYGSIIHITEIYKGEEDVQECDIWNLVTEDGVEFKTKKETIGQFTGLYDKNKTPIYEGDIIGYTDLNGEKQVDGVVEYGAFNCSCCDGVYGWYVENGDIRCIEWHEVIGNIYDNPELIGGKK